MSSAGHVRALAHDQEDESTVHPDEGLILLSDRVSAACLAGGITQTRQITSSLAGIAQRNGQTLVSAIVANPQVGASGVVSRIENQWKVRRGRAGSKRCILGAVLSGDRRQQLARTEPPDCDTDQLRGLFKGEMAGADPAAGSSGPRHDALLIDLVGRRRRTLGILSSIVAQQVTELMMTV